MCLGCLPRILYCRMCGTPPNPKTLHHDTDGKELPTFLQYEASNYSMRAYCVNRQKRSKFIQSLGSNSDRKET